MKHLRNWWHSFWGSKHALQSEDSSELVGVAPRAWSADGHAIQRERLAADLAANFTSYWTRILEVAARCADWTDAAATNATDHEALARRMGELTAAYVRGLVRIRDAAGSVAERTALEDAARRVEHELRRRELAGSDALASFGAAMTDAARAATQAGRRPAPPSASLAGGLLATHLARAAQSGRWNEVGEAAAAVGASSGFGPAATAGFALAIAAVGVLGPPSAVGTLVLSAAAAFGDRWKPLGFVDRESIGRLVILWLESSARALDAGSDGDPAPASAPLRREAGAGSSEIRSNPRTPASGRQ